MVTKNEWYSWYDESIDKSVCKGSNAYSNENKIFVRTPSETPRRRKRCLYAPATPRIVPALQSPNWLYNERHVGNPKLGERRERDPTTGIKKRRRKSGLEKLSE